MQCAMNCMEVGDRGGVAKGGQEGGTAGRVITEQEGPEIAGSRGMMASIKSLLKKKKKPFELMCGVVHMESPSRGTSE